MSHKKPPPLRSNGPSRRRCPVCDEISYSQAGIHPQCAQLRSQSARLQRVERIIPRPSPDAPPKGGPMGRWQKLCPRCSARVHVRQKACPCGHVFGLPGT